MPDSTRTPPAGWMTPGVPDGRSVDADWLMVGGPQIDGVTLKEIRPVATATGCVTEPYRSEWGLDTGPVDQVFQRTLHPGAVTGWHAHAHTIDRLFCGVGLIRVTLYDGRTASPTFGVVWQKTLGAVRPALIVVPPGVWHGVEALGPDTTVLLNLVDKAYDYDQPDHWRLPPDTDLIPYKLR